VPAAAPEEE
jgi:hypothetical protein